MRISFFITLFLVLSRPFFAAEYSSTTFSHAQIIDEYYALCNDIAPVEHSSTTYVEYDRNYSWLERKSSSILPRYTCEGGITSALSQFIQEATGMVIAPWQIQPLDENKGYSGNHIYRVFDADNQPIFLIKIFRDHPGEFSKEFFSQKTFSRSCHTYLKVPTVLGIGSCQIEGKTAFLLAMNYIQGLTLNDMLFSMMQQKQNSAIREKKLNKLIQIYADLGYSMAKFHYPAQTSLQFMHSLHLDRLHMMRNWIFYTLDKHPLPGISTALIKRVFSNFLHLESQKTFRLGYMHNDSHPGNFIYDKVENSVWMIDLPLGTCSIGKNGIPIGLPCIDLVQIKNQIDIKKIYGLTDDECTQLYSAFINQYCLAGGHLPSQESIEFFILLDTLNFLSWYNDHKWNDQDLQRMKKSYEARLAQLKSICEYWR